MSCRFTWYSLGPTCSLDLDIPGFELYSHQTLGMPHWVTGHSFPHLSTGREVQGPWNPKESSS